MAETWRYGNELVLAAKFRKGWGCSLPGLVDPPRATNAMVGR
ncbi:hypothetical protein ACFQ7N_10770 [Streptomyces niveus]